MTHAQSFVLSQWNEVGMQSPEAHWNSVDAQRPVCREVSAKNFHFEFGLLVFSAPSVPFRCVHSLQAVTRLSLSQFITRVAHPINNYHILEMRES